MTTILSGGVVTPPQVLEITEDKNIIPNNRRILIDWVSFTFDDIIYSRYYDEAYKKFHYRIDDTSKNNYIMTRLFRLLGCNDYWQKYEIDDNAVNGYSFSMRIGEDIRINFAGAKSKNNRATTQLLMSGSACREFVKYQNGSFLKLFKFLKKLTGHFKRVDLAIDDFSGNIINIYELEKKARSGEWVGSYQSLMVIDNISFRGGLTSKGYSLTFGSAGSSQLQIYDKKLERESKNIETFKSDVWYRYEMRFIEDKADNFVTQYILRVEDLKNDKNSLSKFASECLYTSIDFKIPSKNKNKSEWKTDPKWLEFIGDVSKINLNSKYDREKSILKKKKWAEHSLETTHAELYLSDPEEYYLYHMNEIGKGIKKLDQRSKVAINRYRESIGKNKLSEKDLNKEIKKLLIEDEKQTVDQETGEIKNLNIEDFM